MWGGNGGADPGRSTGMRMCLIADETLPGLILAISLHTRPSGSFLTDH